MPSKKACPKSKTRNSKGRCVVRHSKTLSKQRRACPPGTRKGSKNGKKACLTVKTSRTSSKKAYVRPSSPIRRSAARRDFEELFRPTSPARMSPVEAPVVRISPVNVSPARSYASARSASPYNSQRAQRRALGYYTPLSPRASPAQSFVSARSATPVDLTFATEVLQNAVVEEIPEMVPATIIPIRVSPETAQSNAAARLAEVEAEVAFAREMQQEAEAAAAYDQELADQGRPRRSNRVRRAPQRLRFGG